MRVCSPEPCQVSWHEQRHLAADDEQKGGGESRGKGEDGSEIRGETMMMRKKTRKRRGGGGRAGDGANTEV